MNHVLILCLTLLLAACNSGGSGTTGQTIQLPQTGQVTSYKAGDDGYYQKGVAWPSQRFVDNADGTVTDRLTGLIWLKNAACIGKKNWTGALLAAGALASGSCGLSDGSQAGDWRLPNINELNSLVNVGLWNPAIGPLTTAGGSSAIPFTLTGNAWYWSSTTSAELSTQAWAVHFLFGQLKPIFKTNSFYTWPLRDGSAVGAVTLARTGQNTSYAAGDDGALRKGAVWPSPRFTDNGNGTITDNLTRLVWLKDTNCLDTAGGIKRLKNGSFSVLTFYEALPWAGGLASGVCGLTDGSKSGDWRIPNRLELQSLMDYGRNNPALPFGHPFRNIPSNGIWSSTVQYDTYTTPTQCWFISPASGIANTATINIKGTLFPDPCHYYLWAVRDNPASN